MANYGLPATEPEQAQFFSQVREGFETASARTGEIVRDFRVAGTSVRLRFAGDALMPTIIPGLAYPVSGAATQGQCEICIWDSESTGVPLGPPPRSWKDFTGRGNIWGFDSARYRSAYQWGEGSVNVMDCETRQAVYWVPSHQYLPAWILSCPLRSILHWWMELNGRQLVHAAAVGHGGRGVLMPGRSGAGKSSTALACLQAGMEFITDDYLAVALDPEPRMYRLYSTAKLDPRSLPLYPQLQTRCRTVSRPGLDKVVLFLEDGYGEQMRESLPLDLVLRPHISGLPETTLRPAEAPEIERALASVTLVQLPHAGPRTVEVLDRVSRQIPGAAIHLGTDRDRIASVVQRALEAGTGNQVPGRQAGSLLKKGTDYSVPKRKHLITGAVFGVDRAVCPLSQQAPRERRPYISVMVHFREDDREEVRTLAAMLEAQGYPRTEFIVTAEGTACGMADEVAGFPGSIGFFSFNDPVVNAEAWNRGIRESFAEWLILIEPGDRFAPGALNTLADDALADASGRESRTAWFRGRQDESLGPLRGALIRKSAFRQCGLFDTNPLLQGHEHQQWLRRAEQKGWMGRQLETVSLHTASARVVPHRLPHNVDWDHLRAQLDRRRQHTLE
jgi:hypothetical protein